MGKRIKWRAAGDEIREGFEANHTATGGLDKDPLFCQVKWWAIEGSIICPYIQSIWVDHHGAMWKARRPIHNANEDLHNGKEGGCKYSEVRINRIC